MSAPLLLADAGSPLMWMMFLHLVFGNLIIAIVEALVLRKFFGVPFRRAAAFLIVANYFSAIVGTLSIAAMGGVVAAQAGAQFIFWVSFIVVGLYLAYLILSVFLEWPFVHRAFTADRRNWRRSLAAVIFCQLVSYTLCLPIFYRASIMPFEQNVHPVRTLEFVREPDLWVHYLSKDGGQLRRIRLDGRQDELVQELDEQTNLRLAARWDEEAERMDLVLQKGMYKDSAPLQVLIESFPTTQSAKTWGPMVVDYRKVDTGVWRVHDPTYRGFTLETEKQPEWRRFGLETPFLRGWVLNPSVLPSEQVVFEMNAGIYILDLETGKLALLTSGRSPVVAMLAE